MTSLMNKVGLYDLLSMVIPGYLTIFLLWGVAATDQAWPYDTLTYGVVIFCLSYIVGLVVHYLSRIAFGWLRHNKWLNNAAYTQFRNDLIAREDEATHSDIIELRQDWYFRTFFHLWRKDSLSHIPPLEAQFSFCRSLCVVGGCYLIFGWSFIHPSWVMSAIAGVSIICFIAIIYIRKKIYYYYYEAEYYLINQKLCNIGNDAQTDNNSDNID